MTEEALFEVRSENLETGLRGYPVGYCTTSRVDPLKGLFYADYPVAEIYDWEPEKVLYLLYYGRVGSVREVAQFSEELRLRVPCPPALLRTIGQLPREGSPMKLFAAALLMAGMLEGKEAYREDGLTLIAQSTEIAAAVIRHHAGWGPPLSSRPELGYAENFTQLLGVPEGDPAQLARAFKLFSVLHYDHGGGNLSVFVAKAVASGLADLYGSMTAAMCALEGSRHGRAGQEGVKFVQEMAQALGAEATDEAAEAFVRRRLAEGKLIFGFGHAVLRVEDPRATVLYEWLQRHYPDHPLVNTALVLRRVGVKVLKSNPQIANPHPNIDAVSGLMLRVSGFPYSEYYPLLFGMARLVGVTRQIIYEREEARGGKGTPIVRPKYFFKPSR